MKIGAQRLRKLSDNSGLSLSEIKFATNYINYYYVDPNKITKFSDALFESHIKKFQESIGLPSTGALDSSTVKAMQVTPRCGCPDYSMNATGVNKWGIQVINYYFESYVTNIISQSVQRELTALAFKQWADTTDLKFNEVSSKSNAHIIISTGRGQASNFDGPGRTLAWAYLPQGPSYNGQLLMRFDLDEKWVSNVSDRGILYLNVATHEFGHSLGLDHSSIQTALMAPYYDEKITKPQQSDDVPRIQRLYGPPKVNPNPSPNPNPNGKYKIEIVVDNLSDIKINGKPPMNFDLI